MGNQVLETSHPLPRLLRASAPLWLIRLPFSIHTSKFRIRQPLCLPLLRKQLGCVPTIPILELRTRHSSLSALSPPRRRRPFGRKLTHALAEQSPAELQPRPRGSPAGRATRRTPRKTP